MTFNFARAHDQYLNPPDEPEAVYCDDCGEEMEEVKGEMKCNYQFCPGKFEGDVREMADQLIDARWEVNVLKNEVKRLERLTKQSER